MATNKKVLLQYSDLAGVFLTIGSRSFGGWSTTALLIEKELIDRRHHLNQAQLKAATSYAQILPGATQVAIVAHIGHQLRGFGGATIATLSYLAPDIILILIFSWAYFSLADSGTITQHLDGLKAALAGIILANAYRIGSRHVTHSLLWLAVGLACVGQFFLHINALYIILAFGAAGLGWYLLQRSRRPL